MTIGARLKAERNRLEMSQSRLAEIGGITKNTQIHLASAVRKFPAWFD